MAPAAPSDVCWKTPANRSPLDSVRARPTSCSPRAEPRRTHWQSTPSAWAAGLIIGATEHDAVRSAAAGARILPVDASGIADLATLETWLRSRSRRAGLPDVGEQRDGNDPAGRRGGRAVSPITALCCTLMPCRRPGECRSASLPSVRIAWPLSSHKLGGPQGAGALLLAPEVSTIVPLIPGGGQERGRRGGTPPMPAIAGFAAATSVGARRSELVSLRDAIEVVALAQGAVVCGAGRTVGQHHLPCTTRCSG